MCLPGLGLILGARVLGEFGDDPTRFADAVSRRAYAGAAPITRASGRSRVVLMRRACNRRLADTCRWWAVAATQRDPRAHAYYQHRRTVGREPRCAGWPASCSVNCATASPTAALTIPTAPGRRRPRVSWPRPPKPR